MALAAVALTGGAIWFATTDSTTLAAANFPEGTEVRLEVARDAEIRTVELYADRVTAKHSVATHGDGSITNYWYRADGTLEKAVTEGPPDADGVRKLKRQAEVAPDGFTYLYDIEYFADGSKSKETKFEQGKLLRSYFHPNGIVRRAQIIVAEKQGWRLTREDLYRPDTSLLESVSYGDNNSWERKFFDEHNVLVSSKAMAGYGTRYVEVEYYPDGVTKRRMVEQNGQGTTLTTYRVNGSRDQERVINGPVSGANMVVYAYDAQDRPTFQQWWSFGESGYYIWQLKTFRDNGSLASSVYFERNSKGATEIVFKGDGAYQSDFTRRKFRNEDGTLALEEDVVKSKVVAAREFTPARNIKLELRKEQTELKDVSPLPRQVIEYAPAPMGGP
jgi:antitoxin component YwqK of YwqJK toxin-antitoxin module